MTFVVVGTGIALLLLLASSKPKIGGILLIILALAALINARKKGVI